MSFEPEKEIRFAVVMYGGVSLAVYMNGVAQELLRLVQATAVDANASGSWRVPGRARESETTLDVYREIANKLGARFVVDILSGTSAGGINAVFLAKALAVGGSLDSVKKTWIKEGDVQSLIFDRESLDASGPKLPNPRPSVLNGDRMYRKLRSALDEVQSDRNNSEPWVDEVRLNVTATDLEGLTVPIALSDHEVWEKRHRKVFRFEYSEDRNDFTPADTAFLAFATRCTSSFPIAFEPPCLDDLARVCPELTEAQRTKSFADWRERFFAEYPSDVGTPFNARVFTDGGYLDNKPFESALDCIQLRDGELPTERVLLYVEPDPEHVEEQKRGSGEDRPNALVNAANVFALPRKESIRSEINRANHIKRTLSRLDRLLEDVHKDVGKLPIETRSPRSTKEWTDWGLERMTAIRGSAYGGYHRAKVGAVTDRLAHLAAKQLGWDVDSDADYALWLIVRAWRKENYFCYSDEKVGGQKSESQFLMDFDVDYRVRRLQFVVRVLDEVHSHFASERTGRKSTFVENSGTRWLKLHPGLDNSAESGLRALRALLRSRLRTFQKRVRDLMLKRAVTGAKELQTGDLFETAREKSGGKIKAGATWIDFRPTAKAVVNQLTARIGNELKDAFIELSEDVEKDFSNSSLVGEMARHFYRQYEDYDSVIFPVLHGTGLVSTGSLEVYRISPDDSELYKKGASKLGGVRYGAFGAFFDANWRRNDLTWGRLDAAEQLIRILLPVESQVQRAERDEWIERAHAAIAREAASEFLSDTAAISLLAARKNGLEKDVAEKIERALDADRFRRHLTEQSPAPSEPDPELLSRSAGRAGAVFSSVLDGIAGNEPLFAPLAAAFSHLTRIGLLFFRVTSVRDVIANPFQSLLTVGAACSIVVAIAGAIFEPRLLQAGLLVAAGTVLLAMLVALVRAFLHRGSVARIAAVAIGALVLGLSGVGAFSVVQLAKTTILKLHSEGRTGSIPGRSETTTNAAQDKGSREPGLNRSE